MMNKNLQEIIKFHKIKKKFKPKKSLYKTIILKVRQMKILKMSKLKLLLIIKDLVWNLMQLS